MTQRLRGDRAALALAAMLALTVISAALGHGRPAAAAAVLIVAIAFVKARWVTLHFMELRAAPRRLRLAFELWGLVLAVTLAVLIAAR